jgi:hypothetical protein
MEPENKYQRLLKQVPNRGGIRRAIQAKLRHWNFEGNPRSNRAVRAFLQQLADQEEHVRSEFRDQVEPVDWSEYHEWRRAERQQEVYA